MILKALDSYHADKKVNNILNEKIHQVGILFDKIFYEHCLSLTKRRRLLQQNITEKTLDRIDGLEMKILHAQLEIKQLNDIIDIYHNKKINS